MQTLHWKLDPNGHFAQQGINPHQLAPMLGYIPGFLDPNCGECAATQINMNYQHGGGWSPFEGFTLTPKGTLAYPDDPELHPIAATCMHGQTIRVYQHAWVCISDDDGYEVARLD